MTKEMDIDLEIEADEVAYIYLGTDKHNNLKNLDLPDSHPIRAITGLQEVVDKVGRTEDGAEVNRIIGVKVNGAPLDIAEDRTVDVPVPTSYGYYLDLDGNNGVISLKDRDGVVLSTIDTNLERIVESGRYDADSNELVLVLDDGSEIRIDASRLVDVYTADGETIVESGHVFALSPGSKEALKDSADHIADTSNPHGVTKEQVGLGNVDNTSDAKKPISEAMQSALNLKANDDAVVHKSGDEEITGVKYFTRRTNWKASLFKYDTFPSAYSQNPSPLFEDVDGNNMGGLFCVGESTAKRVQLDNRALIDGNLVHATLQAVILPNGTTYGTSPSWNVGKADNSDRIVTTLMANSLPSLVHTTGNETISGVKTFTAIPYVANNRPFVYFRAMDSEIGVVGNQDAGIRFGDKNDSPTGGVYNSVTSDGSYCTTSVIAYTTNATSGNLVGSRLILRAYRDGTITTSAPVTTDTAPDDAIVTKKWSLDKFVGKSGDENIKGVKTFQDDVNIDGNWNNLVMAHPKMDTDNPPTDNWVFKKVIFKDKNGNRTGELVNNVNTDGSHDIILRSWFENSTKYTNGYSAFGIKRHTDGTTYGMCPSWSVGTADNSDKLLTTKMANSLPSLVHTTGNETIAGEKTFTTRPIINAEVNAGFYTTATSVDWSQTSNVFSRTFQILSKDKNGVNISQIESSVEDNDRRGLNFSLYGKSGIACNMGLKEYETMRYGYAPATEDTHPDNAIVTKKYLLDKIAALEARIATLEAKS